MTTMKVIAQAGTKCPKESNHREYITDAVAEDVPISIYYLRLINDGSLLRPPDETASAPDAGEPTVSAQKAEVKPETQDPGPVTLDPKKNRGGKS
jgi:hypothetical protein